MTDLSRLEDQRDQARGARIKERRQQLRLTQADVAQQVGITGRAYFEWENRGGPISRGNLHLLADALDTSATYLLTGETFDDQAATGERLAALEQEVARLATGGGSDEVRHLVDDLAAHINQRLSQLEATVQQLAEAIERSLIAADDEDADEAESPEASAPLRRRARRASA